MIGVINEEVLKLQDTINQINNQIHGTILFSVKQEEKPMRFRLSQDDLNKGKLIEPGWYTFRVEKVYEEPSKDKSSTNTKVDCRIVDGEFGGMMVTRVFSEKAPGFVVPFLKAFGIEVVADEEYNLAATENMEFKGYVSHREYNNQKYNDISEFRPL